MATNIYTTLYEEKLVDAITLLRPKIDSLGDWQLKEELEEVASTYRTMLNYLLEGVEDSESPALKRKLIRRVYAINDQANRLIRLKKKPDEQYCKAAMIQWTEPLAPMIKKEGETVAAHDAALRASFDKCWSSGLWNVTEQKEYADMLTSDGYDDNDKALMVSAVTMALFEMFDEKKLMFLFDAYESQPLEINQRALTGILLMMIRYDGRLKFYTDVTARFSLLCEQERFVQECFTILMQLQYSKQTDTVTAKMVHDIMPTIVKSAKSSIKEMGNDKSMTANGENPDWLINPKADGKAEKKIHQMAEMQTEGADVYMSSFCHLKSFPFFGSLHRWLMPFSYQRPYIADIYNQLRPEVARILDKLINAAPFCAGDKYSLAFMIGNIGSQGQDMLMQQIEGQIEEEGMSLDDVFSKPMTPQPRDKEARRVSRNYIFDLYRVFNSYPYHGQFFNPFDKKYNNFTPLGIASLKPLTDNFDNMLALAEFFMRRAQYADAKALFMYLEPKPTEEDADIWQKIGFCQQKLNDSEALVTYKKAYELQPKSKWTVQHIAQTAFDQQEYDTAIEFLDKLLEYDADNLKWIMRKAEAYFATERYAETLPLLYKVNYLDENLRRGKEMLAWALFMTENYEKSERLYHELAEADDAAAIDLINLAHILYAQGHTARAMKYYSKAYQQYMKEADSQKFMDDFWYLGSYLRHVGVDIERLGMVVDAVRLG